MNKLSVMIAASALAFGAWATPSFVQFSSVGPDTYADGTEVVDGEIYALVSVSSDGKFEGINSDGTTVDPNDKILYAAPLALNGHCKNVVFTLKDGQPTSNLAVYLLDTRIKADDGTSTVAGVDENGKLKLVNSYAAVEDAISGGSVAKSTSKEVQTTALATVALGDVPTPTIKGIKVVGAKVEITVANTVPEVRYTVKGGETPSKIDKRDLVSGINGVANGEITLVVDSEAAKDCRFFKVTRATK